MTEYTTKMDEYNIVRKQQMQDNKEKVLNTALKLFLENNIFSITIIDIANQANMSRATMYRYFKNKEEIMFILASRMMEKIYTVAFEGISFDSTDSIAEGYKNMVRKFDELFDAYRYIYMFDALNTNAADISPATINIYQNEYRDLIGVRLDGLTEAEVKRHIVVINIIMDFLEDLASHSELIPITQGISIKDLLDEFEKTIDPLLNI